MSRKIFTFKNKRHMPKWLAYILAGILKIYSWTLRTRIVDSYGVLARMESSPVVFAIWHNRILFVVPQAPRKLLERCAVMISASRDGEYISTLVRIFGLQSARGSSSRGGARALLELEQSMEKGLSPILTVDGPRGPRYTVHSGAAVLARGKGVPLVPVVVNARHFWQMKSWDKMQIPWPFTRVEIVFGEPLTIPPGEEIETANAHVKEALMAITRD